MCLPYQIHRLFHPTFKSTSQVIEKESPFSIRAVRPKANEPYASMTLAVISMNLFSAKRILDFRAPFIA